MSLGDSLAFAGQSHLPQGKSRATTYRLIEQYVEHSDQARRLTVRLLGILAPEIVARVLGAGIEHLLRTSRQTTHQTSLTDTGPLRFAARRRRQLAVTKLSTNKVEAQLLSACGLYSRAQRSQWSLFRTVIRLCRIVAEAETSDAPLCQ